MLLVKILNSILLMYACLYTGFSEKVFENFNIIFGVSGHLDVICNVPLAFEN
jgi:hypothetical protein